mgnify:CR=1 FL=1
MTKFLMKIKTTKPNNARKYSNLVKIMQLPGTTMDDEAIKQMGEYAKNPESYLKDVNQMVKDTIINKEKNK